MKSPRVEGSTSSCYCSSSGSRPCSASMRDLGGEWVAAVACSHLVRPPDSYVRRPGGGLG